MELVIVARSRSRCPDSPTRLLNIISSLFPCCPRVLYLFLSVNEYTVTWPFALQNEVTLVPIYRMCVAFWGLIVMLEVARSSGVNWIVLCCYGENPWLHHLSKLTFFLVSLAGLICCQSCYPAHKQQALPQLLHESWPLVYQSHTQNQSSYTEKAVKWLLNEAMSYLSIDQSLKPSPE